MLLFKLVVCVTCIIYYQVYGDFNTTCALRTNTTGCKRYCNLNKKGVLNSDANITDIIKDPKLKRVTSRCKDDIETDVCKRAEKLHKCVGDKIKNTYNLHFAICKKPKMGISKSAYNRLFPLVLYNQSLVCFNSCILQREGYIRNGSVVGEQFRKYGNKKFTVDTTIRSCVRTKVFKKACLQVVRRIICIVEAIYDRTGRIVKLLPSLYDV